MKFKEIFINYITFIENIKEYISDDYLKNTFNNQENNFPECERLYKRLIRTWGDYDVAFDSTSKFKSAFFNLFEENTFSFLQQTRNQESVATNSKDKIAPATNNQENPNAYQNQNNNTAALLTNKNLLRAYEQKFAILFALLGYAEDAFVDDNEEGGYFVKSSRTVDDVDTNPDEEGSINPRLKQYGADIASNKSTGEDHEERIFNLENAEPPVSNSKFADGSDVNTQATRAEDVISEEDKRIDIELGKTNDRVQAIEEQEIETSTIDIAKAVFDDPVGAVITATGSLFSGTITQNFSSPDINEIIQIPDPDTPGENLATIIDQKTLLDETILVYSFTVEQRLSDLPSKILIDIINYDTSEIVETILDVAIDFSKETQFQSNSITYITNNLPIGRYTLQARTNNFSMIIRDIDIIVNNKKIRTTKVIDTYWDLQPAFIGSGWNGTYFELEIDNSTGKYDRGIAGIVGVQEKQTSSTGSNHDSTYIHVTRNVSTFDKGVILQKITPGTTTHNISSSYDSTTKKYSIRVNYDGQFSNQKEHYQLNVLAQDITFIDGGIFKSKGGGVTWK